MVKRFRIPRNSIIESGVGCIECEVSNFGSKMNKKFHKFTFFMLQQHIFYKHYILITYLTKRLKTI